MLYLYLRIKNWLESDEGQDLAEYALLIGLIAIVAVAGVRLLGQGITNVFGQINTEIGSWFGGGG